MENHKLLLLIPCSNKKTRMPRWNQIGVDTGREKLRSMLHKAPHGGTKIRSAGPKEGSPLCGGNLYLMRINNGQLDLRRTHCGPGWLQNVLCILKRELLERREANGATSAEEKHHSTSHALSHTRLLIFNCCARQPSFVRCSNNGRGKRPLARNSHLAIVRVPSVRVLLAIVSAQCPHVQHRTLCWVLLHVRC